MDMLGSMLRIGKELSNEDGLSKYPSFDFLLRIAKGSKMNWDVAKALVPIPENSIIRVKGNEGMVSFYLQSEAKWEKFNEMRQPLSEYKDEFHKQVRGGGYVEWRNKDFMCPFEPDMILKALGWDRLSNHLKENNLDVNSLTDRQIRAIPFS